MKVGFFENRIYGDLEFLDVGFFESSIFGFRSSDLGRVKFGLMECVEVVHRKTVSSY